VRRVGELALFLAVIAVLVLVRSATRGSGAVCGVEGSAAR
jgi:hypothetical protein